MTSTKSAAAADRGAVKTAKAVVHPVAAKSAWQAIPVRKDRKVCHRCATSRPVSEFSINRAHKDGLNDFDKVCAAAYDAERHAIRKAAGTLPVRKPKAAAKAKPAAAAKAATPKPAPRRASTKAKGTGGAPRAAKAPRPTAPVARVTTTPVVAKVTAA